MTTIEDVLDHGGTDVLSKGLQCRKVMTLLRRKVFNLVGGELIVDPNVGRIGRNSRELAG